MGAIPLQEKLLDFHRPVEDLLVEAMSPSLCCIGGIIGQGSITADNSERTTSIITRILFLWVILVLFM